MGALREIFAGAPSCIQHQRHERSGEVVQCRIIQSGVCGPPERLARNRGQ